MTIVLISGFVSCIINQNFGTSLIVKSKGIEFSFCAIPSYQFFTAVAFDINNSDIGV